MKGNEILNENLKANNKYLREESRSRRMTTMELIEKGIGHNCLSDAYDLGRADKYQEIVSEYMLLTEKQVTDIRADVCDTLTELCDRWVDDDGNCWNMDCPFNDDVCKVMQLKEQK